MRSRSSSTKGKKSQSGTKRHRPSLSDRTTAWLSARPPVIRVKAVFAGIDRQLAAQLADMRQKQSSQASKERGSGKRLLLISIAAVLMLFIVIAAFLRPGRAARADVDMSSDTAMPDASTPFAASTPAQQSTGIAVPAPARSVTLDDSSAPAFRQSLSNNPSESQDETPVDPRNGIIVLPDSQTNSR